MSSEKQRQGIYVTLDCLLDTRLGTLARIDDAAATAVIESGKYHTRQNDVFPGVEKTVFDEMYRNRDVETLKKSMVTNGITLVKHLVGVLTEQAIGMPDHDGAKIVVNIYPYTLNAEEKAEISRAVRAWVLEQAPVELVYIPTKDLTPSHCKSTYSLMIVYDHAEWMNNHSESFAHTRLPEVTMYAPAIYIEHTPTPEELEQTVKEAAHPMRALEMLASPLINLKFIDVTHFSIFTKK